MGLEIACIVSTDLEIACIVSTGLEIAWCPTKSFLLPVEVQAAYSGCARVAMWAPSRTRPRFLAAPVSIKQTPNWMV
jgi:hypothetical protein